MSNPWATELHLSAGYGCGGMSRWQSSIPPPCVCECKFMPKVLARIKQHINLCTYGWLCQYKRGSWILSAERTMTTLKYICPLETLSPSQRTYLWEADSSSVPLNKDTLRTAKQITNKQKQTETMDEAGCTLPCVQIFHALTAERTENSEHLSSTFCCYNKVPVQPCVCEPCYQPLGR